MKINIITYDKVFGFVNYGAIDYEEGKFAYGTTMRCKECGAAWLAENHIEGLWKCPECGTEKKSSILTIK